VKIQLLPSTFDDQGCAAPEQRLTCYVIDDRVAIDGGSLAFAASDDQREQVRDVLVTHPHMDHIASLPIYVDDLFGLLKEPIRIHATAEVIELLERDVFNWTVYPRFAELENEYGPVMQYVPFREGEPFKIAHLTVTAVQVNHIVPTVGLVLTDGKATIAFSSDTYETEEIWKLVNRTPSIDALLIEASFPNDMEQLAEVSRHFTPQTMARELKKVKNHQPDIMVVHIKPTYRQTVVDELTALKMPKLRVMEAGYVYEW
jgi:ribonuclease BN (tRNA processing enzyme)